MLMMLSVPMFRFFNRLAPSILFKTLYKAGEFFRDWATLFNKLHAIFCAVKPFYSRLSTASLVLSIEKLDDFWRQSGQCGEEVVDKACDLQDEQQPESGIEAGGGKRLAGARRPQVDDDPDGPLAGKGSDEYQEIEGGRYPAG